SNTLPYGVIEANVLKQLIEDIDYCMTRTEDPDTVQQQVKAIRDIVAYLNSNAPEPIHVFFKVFRTKYDKVVDTALLEQRNAVSSGYEYL
ncbi:MAG: hypothetical protein ABEK59_07410, partial [Halobacteria archaeon]